MGTITKTIGGNRLGSGNKMTTTLHNYGMSTHDLSESFMSSLAPGVLYPFYCNLAQNGDVFDIDLNAMARTVPTQGPLMGSFKLQMDVFQCPIRLYQGILHNNPINIGMDMSKVKFPKLCLATAAKSYGNDKNNEQISTSCLLKYLGFSGLGTPASGLDEIVYRDINAVPALAYYDIFKNYYANKQEEKAYVITAQKIVEVKSRITGASYKNVSVPLSNETTWPTTDILELLSRSWYEMKFKGEQLNVESVMIYYSRAGEDFQKTIEQYKKGEDENVELQIIKSTKEEIIVRMKWAVTPEDIGYATKDNKSTDADILLKDFDLSNIDKMREDILSDSSLGSPFCIANNELPGNHNYLPYSVLVQQTTDTKTTYNAFEMNGLCVKTYQSDLFNAWVQTEWITGDNGIQAITSVDVSGGSLNLDTLNLSQKVYNMLNRIAVSGGTYEDWQEAVYARKAIRHAESPIYLGGMSSEIVFEEVVSTAETASEDKGVLGSLAGKGKLLGQKGGKLHFEVHEPSFIIGIVSITPRISYNQGNAWYLTDLDSMDDMHKPALDGIGFQDLICEQMAWWDTKLLTTLDGYTVTRSSAGKVPAWINYMTSYNKTFGDFAKTGGKAFMVLNREYERTEDNEIGDLTTYIDPTKFNYAFAYTDLAAQNFWVQIVSDIKARRVMSAKIIPSL